MELHSFPGCSCSKHLYDGEEDDIKKEYSNQFNVANNNNGHTTQVDLVSGGSVTGTTNKYSS
jgi:hypothetical protein